MIAQRTREADQLSRSRHTDPRAIRAARRLAAPRDPRGAGDLGLRRRLGRLLRGLDGAALPAAGGAAAPAALPRVVEAPPRPGFHHPAGRGEVSRFLARLGPEALYGLRSVELCRGPAWLPDAIPCFGRLRVPGRVALHDLPLPPWRWLGPIAARDALALQRAGAIVATDREAGTTVVEWPGTSLATFVLFDVLLHEIGHHLLQHAKGKRLARVARTRDHEAFAARFADRCRAALGHPAPPA